MKRLLSLIIILLTLLVVWVVWAANTGAVYPTLGTSVSEAPWSDNAWNNPSYIYTDGSIYADVTSSQYDTPDQTHVLKAQTFDFSAIPSGSTINGVIVVVNAWYATALTCIDLAQLLNDTGAKGGTNQASPRVDLTTSSTNTVSFGSSTNTWGYALTDTWVKDADFGVALGAVCTGQNCDVYVDYVTMTIYYTPPAGGGRRRFISTQVIN